MEARERRHCFWPYIYHPLVLIWVPVCCVLFFATAGFSNPFPPDSELLQSGFSEALAADSDNCRLVLSQDTAVVQASGGSGSLSVKAEGACDLSMAADGISWLKVAKSKEGEVDIITYTALPNNTSFQRIAGLTIATKVVTITQEGAGRMREAAHREK